MSIETASFYLQSESRRLGYKLALQEPGNAFQVRFIKESFTPKATTGKPHSSKQRYRLTAKGTETLRWLNKKTEG